MNARIDPAYLEVVSREHLLTRPRYSPHGYQFHDTRLNWSRPDIVALAMLCHTGAPLEKAALGLGRTPTALAHRASDTGLKLPREWRDAIYKRRQRRERDERLQYPYIREVRGEHDDLLAVNSLVPRGLPGQLRADICQEIMVAIFCGDTTIEELKSDPRQIGKWINRLKRANYELGGYALSLDAPMRDGRSWYDVLPEPDIAYDEPLHSFDELADAFPSIARSIGGRDEMHKRDRNARDRIAREKAHDYDPYPKRLIVPAHHRSPTKGFSRN